MTSVSEITEQGHTSQEVPKQSTLTYAMTLLKNPAILRQLRVMGPDEERYVRPPKQYEIPPFRENMEYCISNEKYLRPTRYCNPREPEVIAIANELGAYELSDYEFAEAAYWFVKTKLVTEMFPLDGAGATLKRGTGTCYHLLSVWIALCRATGIKARYKTFNMMMPSELVPKQMNEQTATSLDVFNTGGTPEGEGEVYIDDKWVVGHVAMRPEIYAGAGLPISKFGEDATMTFKLIPGTVKRFESIPLKLGIEMKALMWLAPAAMERANVWVRTKSLPEGKKIIEEAGGREAYDRKARDRRLHPPIIEAKENAALVFED
jgi:hypothetical protein